MLPYIFLSVSPLWWGLLANVLYRKSSAYEKRRKFIIVATGLTLFFMIALRCKDLGSSDSDQYYNYWKILSGLSFNDFLDYEKDSRLEIGFLFSTWLLSHIPCFVFPQFIFVFSSLVICITICKFIYQNVDDVILGLTIFICLGLYTFMVQGLRQSIAMCICVVAIEYCKKRKLIKFIFMIFFASLFHQTAIVFLLVYFLYTLKIELKSFMLMIFMWILMLVFCTKILSFFNSAFNMNYDTATESGGFVAVAIYILILIMSIVFAREKKTDSNYCFFFYLTFLGFEVYLIRYIGALIAERISFYFMFGQIVALPLALKNITNSSSKIMKVIIWILCILLFIYRLRGSNLLPYHFFWQ